MKKFFCHFFKAKTGQTSVEYILLVVVAAFIIFKFKDTASARLDELTNKVFDKAGSFVDQID